MPDEVPPSTPDSASFFRRDERAPLVPAPGLEPGKVVGDFELRSLLGQGGMGQVWEARQLSLSRQVAVKFVRPERVTEHQLELFAREARAGGRLSHAGIVAVYGHGESDGLAWIAMELIPGAWDLRDFLDEMTRAGEVPDGYDRKVAEFVAQIADAVQAAHEAGVIHRDLKPQNILITERDRPKVTDFGLARIIDETALSHTGDFAGTYFYMSPEQVAAKRAGLDHRTDVFSLGIVLYEMLALVRPFQGDTEHQVAEQILTYEPPAITKARSRVPRDLGVICAKALEKRRSHRYQSMGELAADLRRWLANESIVARAPTRVDRAAKWCKRNPTKSVAGALTALALVVISVLLVANVRKTEQAEESARIASENEQRADREALAATQRSEEVLRLSALSDLEQLLAEADELWPAHFEQIASYESWIDRARKIVSALPEHIAKRDQLRAQALPRSDAQRRRERETHPEYGRWQALLSSLNERIKALPLARSAEEYSATEEELVLLESDRAKLNLVLDERRDWLFPESKSEASWWEKQLSKLIDGLQRLELDLLDPEAVSESHGWSMPKRVAFARTIGERSVDGEEACGRWSEAIAGIARSDAYGGLQLTPQTGLIPIGPDQTSGLWEFAHLQTGEPALKNDGSIKPRNRDGLVLVLLPEGELDWDPSRHQIEFDARAATKGGNTNRVSLEPFFISKFELTVAQWGRLVGGFESSAFDSAREKQGIEEGEPPGPVTSPTFVEMREILARAILSLPSGRQWEYAARAGTNTMWWTGDDPAVLPNVAQLHYPLGDSGGLDTLIDPQPIGLLRANAFGLHDIIGNVAEWCRDDDYAVTIVSRATDSNGFFVVSENHLDGVVTARGGSYMSKPDEGRIAFRRPGGDEGFGWIDIGVRPTRVLEGEWSHRDNSDD